MVKYDFESMTYMSNRLMTFSGQHAQTTGTGQYQLMKKAPDKHRSGQTELIACAFLLGEGYEVFRNVSACGPIDLIACKGMETRRIDVKSGAYKLTPAQEKEGIVVLYVDENGRCEFDTDRKQRFAEAARAALIAVTGFQPKVAAEHLNTLGIRTPRGSCWSPGTIVQMRERFASA